MIEITISSLKRADDRLRTGNYDALVSIGAPGGSQHCTLRTPNNLLLAFWDMAPNIARNKALPPTSDIVKLIQWGKLLTNEKVLVHCMQGKSRSTAAGIILYLCNGYSEETAVSKIFQVAPKAMPNWYMLTLADQLLHTNSLGFMRANDWKLKTTRKDIHI